MIYGDMRKPTQNYIFNEQNNNGLSSLSLAERLCQKQLRRQKLKI